MFDIHFVPAFHPRPAVAQLCPTQFCVQGHLMGFPTPLSAATPFADPLLCFPLWVVSLQSYLPTPVPFALTVGLPGSWENAENLGE